MEDLQAEEEQGRYLEKILGVLDREFQEGYYAQMAAAWLLAELFVTFPARTFQALKTLRLDPFTRKKAVQKIRESRIPDSGVQDSRRASENVFKGLEILRFVKNCSRHFMLY